MPDLGFGQISGPLPTMSVLAIRSVFTVQIRYDVANDNR